MHAHTHIDTHVHTHTLICTHAHTHTGVYTLSLYRDYDQNPRSFYDRVVDDLYIRVGKYDQVTDYAEYKKLLFPLHFEPEATLSYFAPAFSDQRGIIREIARNLPLNWALLVKEHPSQAGLLLTRGYNELRRQNSNLAYLHGGIDSFSLLSESIDAVVTISGSVGWEALVLGVPTIVLGNVFYDKHPRVIKLEDYGNLPECLSATTDAAPNDELTIDYLTRVLAYAHKGIFQGKHRESSDNIADLVAAIEHELIRTEHA